MSKRTQSIRSLFAGGGEQPPTDEARQPVQRVASGAVRSLKDTFSEVERDYEELKRQVAKGAVPVEIDPELIDPSPFADRFADQDVEAVEALKTSMREHGQEIPVLLRPHPSAPGRYQIAYGHRRVRAAGALGLKVKAYIRDLDDDRLVVAQGIENSAREDLTFIERAVFALRLEDGGFQRSLIQTALSVDRQEAHRLVSVARAVPAWLVNAIGRAPKVGRPRWQELTDLLKTAGAERRARKITEDVVFAHKATDDRFLVVLKALKAGEDHSSAKPAEKLVARSPAGEAIATMSVAGRNCKIEINRDRDADFARFLMERLPALYESYRAETSPSDQ